MIGIQIALRTSNCTSAPCQFYSDPVMLEFLLGIAAFWIFSLVSWDRYKEARGIWPLLFALSIVGLIIVATKPEVASVGNFPIILPPTAIFAFAVVLFAVLSESDGAVVKCRWVLLLGNASYLIYLIHPFIVQGFDRVISKWIPTLTTRTLIGLLVYLIALVSVSVMFHLKIERRILNLGRHFLERASAQRASAAWASGPSFHPTVLAPSQAQIDQVHKSSSVQEC